MNCHTDIGPCPDLTGRRYRWLADPRHKRFDDALVIAMCPAGSDIFALVHKSEIATKRFTIAAVSRYHRAILENEKGKFVVVTPKLYAELEQRRWRTACASMINS